ncbi:hypothetical protein BD414DRAFT_472935 [Trametes punicea]|nr:hypothetical protein BD414DRAFT_472935 [Trametes punicea]
MATSPAIATTAAQEMSSTTDAAVPRPITSKSLLNPNAPVWEFKPHQRAMTVCEAQSPPTNASPLTPQSTTSPPQSASPQDLEVELQRLRVMLRDCGLEDRRFSTQLPGQGHSIWSMPGPAQSSVHSAMVQSAIVNFGNAPMIQRAMAPQPQRDAAAHSGPATRQRTQTHNPLVSQASLQGGGVTPRNVVHQLQQPEDSNGRPGLMPAHFAIPPVPPPFHMPLGPTGVQAQPFKPTSAEHARAAQLNPVGRPEPSIYRACPPQQTSNSVPLANAQQGFQFAKAGQRPGSTSSLLPPGTGRARPNPFDAGSAFPPQNARFYGIETPRVVFESHGWTVDKS